MRVFSQIRTWPMAKLYFVNTLAVLFSCGLAIPWRQVMDGEASGWKQRHWRWVATLTTSSPALYCRAVPQPMLQPSSSL